MLFYRATLPLSSRILTFVSGVIRRYRVSTRSCWRELNPGSRRFSSSPTCGKARRSPSSRPGSRSALRPRGDTWKGPWPCSRPDRRSSARRPGTRRRPDTPGESASAQLKTWRILRKLRCCPWRAVPAVVPGQQGMAQSQTARLGVASDLPGCDDTLRLPQIRTFASRTPCTPVSTYHADDQPDETQPSQNLEQAQWMPGVNPQHDRIQENQHCEAE
jgi:hypothetical protein